MNDWFEVNKAGLGKILERRGGKAFILFELIQNAWDENIKTVDVKFDIVPGKPLATLKVTDDSPDGFRNLADAFTLFAESYKKSNPQQRGRFDLGEKLVLACCKNASISSTKGEIFFNEDGTRSETNKKRKFGTVFSALFPCTRKEYDEACIAVNTLIPPMHVLTTFNGVDLEYRIPRFEAVCKLPTEIADDEGNLRRTIRKTNIRILEPKPGEKASIYEMGIPIVETGDKFHVDVQQKVPLNMDRDNVQPAYLRDIRTFVFNETFDLLKGEDARAAWVNTALEDKRCEPDGVKKIVEDRFGKNAATYDPSDPESSKMWTSKGNPVIYGGAFNKSQWKNIKDSGALPSTGTVCPSAKINFGLNGKPLNLIPLAEQTESMTKVVSYTQLLGKELMGIDVRVEIANNSQLSFVACYGTEGVPKDEFFFNAGKLGKKWFDKYPGDMTSIDDLIIHEFGHHYCGDHLSEKYYDALTMLGAKLKDLVLRKPYYFEDQVPLEVRIQSR